MNISNLITYLNTIWWITAITWSRIFWGLPKSEQTSTYMTVNIITETQPTDVEKRNRIEFRMIWGDNKTTYNTLKTLDDLVVSSIRDYTWDWVYKAVIWNLVNWYDNKNRKVYIRDLIIYYTN